MRNKDTTKKHSEDLKKTDEQRQREITSQVLAEKKLEESEQIYRSVFENTGAATVIIEEDMTISMANSEFEKLSGYSKEQMEGKIKWTEFVVKEDLEKMKEYHDTRRQNGVQAPKEYEFRFVDKQRNIKHIFNTVGIIPGTGKSVASLTDITKHRSIEEALQKSEERYRSLFDRLPLGVFQSTPDGRFLDANPAFTRLLGCPDLETLLSTPVITFYRDPEEREQWKKLTEKEGGPFAMEVQWQKLDGTLFWIRESARVVKDSQGKVQYYEGVAEDITERKRAEKALRESEEKYRLLVENADDAIFIAQDETIKFPNPKTVQISGYSKKELAKIRFIDLIHPEDRDMVLDRHRRRLTGEDFPNTYSFRIANRDNEELWGELNTVLISWEGKPATLNFLRDVTQQNKLEAQLQQAQRMEAIGTLAGGIAHDFNNILFAIIGYTEIALYNELPKDSQARQSLEQVLKASHRARDLVKQILAFSRQSKQQRKPLEIGPIMKESLKLLRASLPSTIKIRQDIPRSSGSIMADPSQIHQVLMNLCTNASYTMRDKGGDLGVSLCEVDLRPEDVARYPDLNPGPYLKLTVRDTGCGMDPEVMNKIFEPYFTTKPKGEGTGLGLSVVHGIVRAYGGMITAESEPGKGTTFNVFFPKAEGEATPKVIDLGPVPTGSERILIVDDEETLVAIMEHALKNLGYTVTATTSSIEALESFRARSEEFDMVITDQTMPSLTGDKLARELMKIRPDIPIILATGFSEEITEQKAMQMGIREFVMKPLVIREMAQAIRRALNY